MALGIPNDPSAAVNPAGNVLQAQVDSADIDMLVASEMGTGVQSGGAVTVVSALQVNVAAATTQIQGGTNITVGSQNLTLAAADGAQPRFDLIYTDSGGTAHALQGAPGAAPDFAALSKDGSGNVNVVYHAAVLVLAKATTLISANIIDKRTPLSPMQSDSGWTDITSFTNSWVSNTQPSYRKIGNAVYLKGEVKSGTVSTSAFTLPAGFRPAFTHRFPVVTNGGTGGCLIGTDGTFTIFVTTGANTLVGVYCSFLVN